MNVSTKIEEANKKKHTRVSRASTAAFWLVKNTPHRPLQTLRWLVLAFIGPHWLVWSVVGLVGVCWLVVVLPW